MGELIKIKRFVLKLRGVYLGNNKNIWILRTAATAKKRWRTITRATIVNSCKARTAI